MLIRSKSREEHVQHLREALSRLKQHSIVLNGEKCVLGVPEVQFLGHIVSACGIIPLPEKVAAICRAGNSLIGFPSKSLRVAHLSGAT